VVTLFHAVTEVVLHESKSHVTSVAKLLLEKRSSGCWLDAVLQKILSCMTVNWPEQVRHDRISFGLPLDIS